LQFNFGSFIGRSAIKWGLTKLGKNVCQTNSSASLQQYISSRQAARNYFLDQGLGIDAVAIACKLTQNCRKHDMKMSSLLPCIIHVVVLTWISLDNEARVPEITIPVVPSLTLVVQIHGYWCMAYETIWRKASVTLL